MMSGRNDDAGLTATERGDAGSIFKLLPVRGTGADSRVGTRNEIEERDREIKNKMSEDAQ